MKNYRVEINHSYRHGQYGTDRPHIVTLTVAASSKKQAKENALNSLIGKVAGDYKDFPIDLAHAPEAFQDKHGWWSIWMKDRDAHIINAYDVEQKNVFSINVEELR